MRIRSLVLIVAFVAAVAAGCSASDTGTTTNAGGTSTPTVAATTPPTTGATGTTAKAPGTSAPAAGGAAELALADSPLGSILVDGQGMTVYVFMKDTATTSACTDSCAQAWPAVSGSSVDAGTGLDAGAFTTITGADGAPQIVFNGHPLYTYAGDNAAGETSGQGLGGNWFVVGATGEPMQTTP